MAEILVSENIRGEAMDRLAQRFSVVMEPELWRDQAALLGRVGEFRGLIVRNQTQVTRELLAAAKHMEVVGRAGVGLDNVDVAAATELGVQIVWTPEQNAISVAELAIGLMLSLARMIGAADADTRAGGWNRQRYVGTEMYGKTFGIVGAGKIGFLTARRAQAFGMKVLAYDPFVSRDNVYLAELQAELVSLDELLARADVVSCHLPATAQTQGLLNAERFRQMKPSAIFLNTSRGEVVVENDLAEALRAGVIAGAALDVRTKEPPVPGALEGAPNLLLTPHIAAFTQEAQERVTRAICDDVARVLDGLPAQNAVNRVMQKEAKR